MLVLGGTTEASLLARALAEAGVEALFSYAGRTDAPVAQPLPIRIGGFGGAEGLAGFLRQGGFTHVVDATHPFAAQISRNALAACAQTRTPLLALERPAWTPGPGDRWTLVRDAEAAVAALPRSPARVFLAIGKQGLTAFARQPRHHYLLRLIDPPDGPLPLPRTSVVLARGPFDAAADEALLRNHGITHVVAKNAGGSGAEAKLVAARALGLPVILIERPVLPPRQAVATTAEVMGWLAHAGTDRGE